MMNIKLEFPQFIPNNNSPEKKGKGEETAKSPPLTIKNNSTKLNKNLPLFNELAKYLKLPNASLNGTLHARHGFLTLGNLIHGNFSANTNVSLNANSQGFAIGLNQNLNLTIEFFFETLPPEIQNKFQNLTSQQVIAALFLGNSINVLLKNSNILSNGKSLDFVESHPILKEIFTILLNNNPNETPVKQIQRLCNVFQKFCQNCSCAKTVGELEIISEKFAKVLSKGDLQTLVKLAEIVQKTQNQSEQVADKSKTFLFQLVSKGESEAVKIGQTANLSVSQNNAIKAEKNVNQNFAFGVKNNIYVTNREKIEKNDFYTEKTELALRQKLDFYPHFVSERQISSFEKPEDATLGKNEFVKNHYSEIEDWINSGRHRLVKDFEFDKPLGMIVDRDESGFITASKIRVVLVRDGSVEGWHFLRSFLIS